jgi:hypothetical protein
MTPQLYDAERFVNVGLGDQDRLRSDLTSEDGSQ